MNEDSREKEKLIINYFFENPNTYISEMSKDINIPKSTIQRYLSKNKDKIIPGLGVTIGVQLERNKNSGQRKGGINSFKNNDATKDSSGRFTGSIRTTSLVDKEEKMKSDIYKIYMLLIKNPTKTLNELVQELSDAEIYSRDYVYDCLTDKRINEIIGFEAATKVKEILKKNRLSFFRKIEGFNINDLFQTSDLTEQERKILELRMKNKSLDEIADELNLSRSAVLKHENRAIEKIQSKIITGTEK